MYKNNYLLRKRESWFRFRNVLPFVYGYLNRFNCKHVFYLYNSLFKLNNMFTSNNVYLKTNRTDINAKEIKYLRIVKEISNILQKYNKLSYLPEKEDRLCEREMSMLHNDKQYYMRVKRRIYVMRIVITGNFHS